MSQDAGGCSWDDDAGSGVNSRLWFVGSDGVGGAAGVTNFGRALRDHHERIRI